MVQIENDVYSQIGLVMLIGLAAKNAILIVEFAKDEFEKGKPLADAALEGARLRLRPILMTSFAFILGCVPLWTATGAGSVARQIMGTTVIGGMLAASVIGIFLIPAIFYVVEKLSGASAAQLPASRRSRRRRRETDDEALTDCCRRWRRCCSAGCTVGPNYTRPAVPVPRAFRAPEPLPAAAGRVARRPQVVRGLQGRTTAGADPHRAGAELRPARRGGARGGGARQPRHHALQPVSASSARAAALEINRLSRDGATAAACVVSALAESQLGGRRRSICCRSRSISGAGCAAPPKPRAPIC